MGISIREFTRHRSVSSVLRPPELCSLQPAVSIRQQPSVRAPRASGKAFAALSTSEIAHHHHHHQTQRLISDTHPEDGKLIVTFRWPAALEGSDVSVIGSFNDWKAPLILRKSPENGDYVRSVPLLPGAYQYKYTVDGSWRTSPCEPITGDGQGQFNNHRVIAASATFKWQVKWGGKEIFVTGDFCAWAELIPLSLHGDTYTLECSLPAGTYSYQFLVDGAWMTSPDAPIVPDDDGHLCNKIDVRTPSAFHISYATGWENVRLHYRELMHDGRPVSEWQSMGMSRSASRAAPQGGAWFTSIIPTSSQNTSTGKLEFYTSSKPSQRATEKTDKPVGKSSYTCPGPGGYKLEKGQLKPFSRATAPPAMLVSDLDGTMVGEGDVADGKTQDFCTYWESNAALAGGVLVYNTGRSLGGFISLMQEKKGALALPDVLITAVGTKIFLLDHQAEGRGTASIDNWTEDLQWAKRLDYGWDLEVVKEVANALIQSTDDSCHWLDHGTEHPHRIALSVREESLEHVVLQLERGFEESDVQVQIIVSGLGGWRYVDCVSAKGGKLEALEYVRTLFGIPRDRCAAAGDSGNDVLMLEGENKAIVVGNGQPTLVDWLLHQPQNDRIIFTDGHMAHGILEGLARHGMY